MKIFAAALAGIALVAAANVQAAYPDRAIKVIVPWKAGGDTDNIFRPFVPGMQKALGGSSVVIANVGGASGTVGAREAKNSPPDGYTLFAVHDYIHSTYYTGISDVNYWDFAPVCLIASTPIDSDREPEDEVEDHAGNGCRRQSAPRHDFGRRDLGFDQPFLPGTGGKGREDKIQVRFL